LVGEGRTVLVPYRIHEDYAHMLFDILSVVVVEKDEFVRVFLIG